MALIDLSQYHCNRFYNHFDHNDQKTMVVFYAFVPRLHIGYYNLIDTNLIMSFSDYVIYKRIGSDDPDFGPEGQVKLFDNSYLITDPDLEDYCSRTTVTPTLWRLRKGRDISGNSYFCDEIILNRVHVIDISLLPDNLKLYYKLKTNP